MAYFAQLDDFSIVTQVIAVNNETIDYLPFPESEPVGVAFCQSLLGADTIWKQTSYNSNFRKNYAAAGYTYNSLYDVFIPPSPHPTWILNTATFEWEPLNYVTPITDGVPPEVI
jgi:hypothetical protein